MKIDLAEINTINSYSFSNGSEEMSLLEYETILSSIDNLSDEVALVSILKSIKENSTLFKNMLNKELLSLEKPLNTKTDKNEYPKKDKEPYNIDTLFKNCILLQKLKNIFNKNKTVLINKITVYDSLINASYEQGVVSFYSNELLSLIDIIRNQIELFMKSHKSIKKDDSNYADVKRISFILSELIVSIRKLSSDSIKRSASSFLSEKSLEEQFMFFQNYFSNQGKTKKLLNNKSSNKISLIENEGSIIDAEIEENPREQQLIKNISMLIDTKFEENRKIQLQAPNNSALSDKIIELKEEMKSMKTANAKVVENFNEFIVNQTRLSEAVKAKYNIKTT